MLKILCFIIILLFLSSCVPETPPPPLGVWKCYDVGIMLYLDPVYQHPLRQNVWLGYSFADEERTRIFARFGNGAGRINIYDFDTQLTEGGGISGLTLYSGRFYESNNQIHLTFSERVAARIGIESTIFYRVTEYPTIDLNEWFPHLDDALRGVYSDFVIE